MITTRRQKKTTFGALTAVLLVAGLLGACSSDADEKTSGGGESTSAGSDAKKDLSFGDWQVAFSECMADEGVEMPVAGDGSVSIDMGAIDQEQFMQASTTCIDKIGEAPAREGAADTSPEEAVDAQLKMVQCLRERGYTVEDPKGGALGLPGDMKEEDVTACMKAAG